MTEGFDAPGKGPTGREAGQPMKQKAIGFRELLERLLPVDELPPAERLRVERALRSGVGRELERAALEAIELLEQRGALRRLPVAPASTGVVRYQSRDTVDVITLELEQPRERDGIAIYSRAALPAQAQARLDQVRRLFRIEDPLLLSDPRSAHTRNALIRQLDHAGRELLEASEVRFFPAESEEEVGPEDTPLDKTLAAEVCAHPDAIYYCADTERSGRVAVESRRRRLRSVTLSAVQSSSGTLLGHLEVRHTEPEPFRPHDLALVALLADYCGGVLERAARIEKLAFIDPLTSAYNRSYFDLQAKNEMARALRERASLALLIADIDDFKSFNTAFGYEAGNQVLIAVAQGLKRGVRPFDTVSRWGGEEFAVLLTPPVHAEDVVAISERLRATVERATIRVEGLDREAHRVGVTVSIGVALFPEHAENSADLWRVANQALLKAKRPPKNQVVFYKPQGDPRFGTR